MSTYKVDEKSKSLEKESSFVVKFFNDFTELSIP
jgi:hypothetical protein